MSRMIFTVILLHHHLLLRLEILEGTPWNTLRNYLRRLLNSGWELGILLLLLLKLHIDAALLHFHVLV